MVSSMRLTSGLACLLAALNLRAGVVITSPPPGASVASPVPLIATISGSSQPSAILVYDNNSLIQQLQGAASIEESLTLTAGVHTLTVYATYSRKGSSSAKTQITVSTVPISPTTLSASAAEISADMTGLNEGNPHGVPLSYDWANGPVIEMGNNANGWQALTAWGVVYEAAQGNPAVNTRVNIRDVQTFFLQKSTGNWLLLQNTSQPAGAAYLEDFANDTSISGNVRTEPDGTISVTAGCPQNCGYNYHFYPADRASINPNDIGGILTIFQARLIVGNPALPDDRSIAQYLAGSGADYYPALTGGWPGTLTYNPGAGIGKEKYVQTEWRFYSMTTLSAAQLTANPPPVVLTNIAP